MATAAFVGIVTVHMAFPSVFDVYPYRQQADVDGYVALASCAELGNRYILASRGGVFLVSVADCGAPGWEPSIPGWIADVGQRLWSGPYVPQRASLWHPVDWERMQRIQ